MEIFLSGSIVPVGELACVYSQPAGLVGVNVVNLYFILLLDLGPPILWSLKTSFSKFP